jgi:hypothetical protein
MRAGIANLNDARRRGSPGRVIGDGVDHRQADRGGTGAGGPAGGKIEKCDFALAGFFHLGRSVGSHFEVRGLYGHAMTCNSGLNRCFLGIGLGRKAVFEFSGKEGKTRHG